MSVWKRLVSHHHVSVPAVNVFLCFGRSKRRKKGRKVPAVEMTSFNCENLIFGPWWIKRHEMAHFRVTSAVLFFSTKYFIAGISIRV